MATPFAKQANTMEINSAPAAYKGLLPEIMAVPDAQLMHINLEIPLLVTTAQPLAGRGAIAKVQVDHGLVGNVGVVGQRLEVVDGPRPADRCCARADVQETTQGRGAR